MGLKEFPGLISRYPESVRFSSLEIKKYNWPNVTDERIKKKKKDVGLKCQNCLSDVVLGRFTMKMLQV